MMKADVLLKNGTILDPSQDVFEASDIAFADGKVLKRGRDLELQGITTEQTLDVAGKIVTPGFIDLHVHVYPGISHYGIEVDSSCLKRGVTTAVDAGSAGAHTFEGFRRFIIEASRTRLYALLNISSQGMLCDEIGELDDIRYAGVSRAVQVCEAHRDVILGVKVRLTPKIVGDNGREALKRAREAADATRRMLMVHPNGADFPLREILAELRAGDVLTHCFHGMANGILDDSGKVKPEVHRAIERGVLLDVGHGRGSFTFNVARAAISQGIEPHTISSDLHRYNINGPVYDLATTVSKFLYLGFPLQEVIRKVTIAPARAMQCEQIGTLREGACADATVLDLVEKRCDFTDCEGTTAIGDQKLVPVLVVRQGHAMIL